MSDFNSWDEVEEFLLEDEGVNQVEYWSWVWSSGYKTCSSGCCDDSLSNIKECLDDIQYFCSDLKELTKF